VTSSTASVSDVILEAVTTEFGSTIGSSGESGALVGLFAKVSVNASITGKRASTESEASTTGSSTTDSVTYTVAVPARRLAIRVKGQPSNELDLQE
jgi:hypothetical protein